ncbi:FLUCTUATING-LIGHT-ACCLIMATION protein 1, chloroplastic-like [Bidens hawaiensis]|uniref:FLUCTUATING-LIGHT-ACCLIMATION protein 1, chloroplastic-like n=1 Tax=Bidens hawaiensis TaxID=980011 RepID=UPI00404A7C99
MPVITNLVLFKVGSLNTGRSLQRDINRIAEVADTSTSKGWNFVLQESILSLLRHSNYSISGYSLVDAMSSVVECEERFNQHTIEESGEFDEVTVDNVNNTETKVQQAIVLVGSLTSILWLVSKLISGYYLYSLLNYTISIVQHTLTRKHFLLKVILIVALDIVPQPPPMESSAQLEEALQNLASIPSGIIMVSTLTMHLFFNP